jgi:hypothetical protein
LLRKGVALWTIDGSEANLRESGVRNATDTVSRIRHDVYCRTEAFMTAWRSKILIVLLALIAIPAVASAAGAAAHHHRHHHHRRR